MSPAALPDLECACASVRRVSRLITQLYAQEMGSEIEPSQFALLTALSQHPGCSQVRLGTALGFDKTTISRNLSLMKKNGWIEIVKASRADRRERGYRLTVSGERMFSATKPRWKRAQSKLREAMKPSDWENMQQMLSLVARAALSAQHASNAA